MTELNIVPECEVDTRLVQILANLKKPPNHGKVANKLKDNLKNKPALAIIDFDKTSVRNLNTLKVLSQSLSRTI